MPCSDERPGDREHAANLREGAALLCRMLRAQEESGDLGGWPEDVRAWWERHKEIDAFVKRASAVPTK